MIEADTPLRDVAFEVCTALGLAGTTAVLTGGGAATVYAPGAIQSFDLDFVLTFGGRGQAPLRALEGLGYRRSGTHYEHAENKLIVEFPPGPLSIGGELIESWETLEERGLLLHILSPTDSCRDRLAAFYHFDDRSALAAALAIQEATGDRVDLGLVRAWSREEGADDRLGEFERLIRERT